LRPATQEAEIRGKRSEAWIGKVNVNLYEKTKTNLKAKD
jgi:hypothetical protein